ncbi:MAG TPA: PQQ-binding-like beta-propeller repeat protein [Gemmataceae bacterium]
MRLLLALVGTVVWSSWIVAADGDKSSQWHHWRGPEENGFAAKATPPLRWDASTNIRWKTALPGKGSSTPIVWGERVFVMAAEKTDREAKPDELPKPDPRFTPKTEPPRHFYKFIVLCFDRNSGKKLWEKIAAERVPHEGHHASHSYCAGSPTTDGQRLYASFGSFGTYCYDFNGKPLWSRDFGRMNTRLGWGEAVTPVIHGKSLLLNFDQEADSLLYCLDPATGETKWAAKRNEKTSWNTPLVAEFRGKTQVIVNGTARIRGHDLATGEVLWSCGGMTTNAIPSPVRLGNSVLCMSGYGPGQVVSIPLGSHGDLGLGGNVNWRHKGGTPYVPSPLLADGRLYFTQLNDNLLTVLDAETGKVLIDKERLPGVRNFYASPLGAAGRVYFVDRYGTTLVIKAGKDEVEVLATNKLDDAIDASPVAVGKQLFLRGEKLLYCIEE